MGKNEKVAYPICPMEIYFEGEEDICNTKKCDFDPDTRSCSEGCKSQISKMEE